jgi:hypothetical protein
MQARQVAMSLQVKYSQISWMLRILIGGAFNIVFLRILFDYASSNVNNIGGVYYFTHNAVPMIIGLSALVILSPLLLSLVLTKRQPELKIVSPLWITMVTFIWILIVEIFPPLTGTSVLAVYFGAFLLFVGWAEDSFAISMLGIATTRESIFFEHLKVYKEIDQVKTRLSTPEIRAALDLSEIVEGDAGQGYTLRTIGKYFDAYRILLTKDKKHPNWTDVKIVYFRKGKYNLEVSPSIIEIAKLSSAGVKDVFENRKPRMKIKVIVPFKNNVIDPLVDSVIDEMRGYIYRFRRIPMESRIKAIGFVVILVITIGLFVAGQFAYGGITGAIDVLYLFTELSDMLRERR